MDRLFMMRHGQYDDEYELSERGIEQVEQTLELLKEELSGYDGRIHLVYSKQVRSMQTVEILRDAFPGASMRMRFFCEMLDNYGEYRRMMGELAQLEGAVLISGHQPLLKKFPWYVVRDLGEGYFSEEPCGQCVGPGQGHYYDLEAKVFKHIPRTDYHNAF